VCVCGDMLSSTVVVSVKISESASSKDVPPDMSVLLLCKSLSNSGILAWISVNYLTGEYCEVYL